jgi:hypothetical protein
MSCKELEIRSRVSQMFGDLLNIIILTRHFGSERRFCKAELVLVVSWVESLYVTARPDKRLQCHIYSHHRRELLRRDKGQPDLSARPLTIQAIERTVCLTHETPHLG